MLPSGRTPRWPAAFRILSLALFFAPLGLSGCGSGDKTVDAPPSIAGPPQVLSAYNLFVGDSALQKPAPGVIPYDLNTPLFSDYTDKLRFIKLPASATIQYHESAPFDFPTGTIIAKTFLLPTAVDDPDAKSAAPRRRLLETRILRREDSGWTANTYIWNDAQTEAVLEVAGGEVDVAWQTPAGTIRRNQYLIPNVNQCKGCHVTNAADDDRALEPIGPTARQLNRDFAYADGTENQLDHWRRLGILTGGPSSFSAAPRLAVWNDSATGSLDERARAWLEINCAHCHSSKGPARNSGLDLSFAQRAPAKWGVFKSPVAAGRGTGGRLYDIVPGQPDQSILLYRIASDQAQIMMPELGKRLVHAEGVALIREWIASLPAKPSAN